MTSSAISNHSDFLAGIQIGPQGQRRRRPGGEWGGHGSKQARTTHLVSPTRPGLLSSSDIRRDTMPVKLRKAKARTAQITDEARAIFAEAIKLQAIYHGCSRPDACRSTFVNQHCTDCAKYIELSQELCRAVGTKPWEANPLNADSESPPDYMQHNPLQADYWRKAWAIRCELEAK
jgi:hypothetical protein